MVAVSGFKVALTLKDGSQVEGIVKECVNKQLVLKEGPVIEGHDILDLKVVDIPSSLRQKKKNKSKSKKEKKEDKKEEKKEDNNGYNNSKNDSFSDNVTRIKNSGDFDFAQSTADFNKRSALKEFEDNDSIEASMRLVGHNKIKTKFDHDEMVLDNVNKSATNAIKNLIKVKDSSNKSTSTKENKVFSVNDLALPLATPLQLVQAEETSATKFGFSSLLASENAAIGLTKLIIKLLGGPSRISSTNHNALPLVLITIGNNRTGARALATARKLLNVGVEVSVYSTIDLNQDNDEIDPQLVEQLDLFKPYNNPIITSLSTLSQKLKKSQPELIIDALQGHDTNISDLVDEELENTIELVKWINQKDISVLSIDVPSGIDAGSGVSSSNIFIKSKYIASLGLIIVGLQHAYENKLVTAGDWRHYLIDLGIPNGVYLKGKGGLKKFEVVKFVENVLKVDF